MIKNKWTSIEHLKGEGLNTPKCFLITSVSELANFRETWNKDNISIRTFKWNEKTFNDPHMPNVKLDNYLLALKDLLKRGYYIILSEPISPLWSEFRGNISVKSPTGSPSFLTWLIEYMEGPGTVRDLEEVSAEKILSCSKEEVVKEVIGQWGLEVVSVAQRLFKKHLIYDDFPIQDEMILEWSILDRPVGWKKKGLVFWEIR